ncbi:MAG: hypothetical protein J6T10_03805 [Methanobrevibacter sp.]|nr:hypothetical protein [Methanobrevibacter sp.]
MKQLSRRFNFRYWVLYLKSEALTDPEYLKRKNAYKTVLEVLKKYYPAEKNEIKKAIETFSQVIRNNYPEINSELPK